MMIIWFLDMVNDVSIYLMNGNILLDEMNGI